MDVFEQVGLQRVRLQTQHCWQRRPPEFSEGKKGRCTLETPTYVSSEPPSTLNTQLLQSASLHLMSCHNALEHGANAAAEEQDVQLCNASSACAAQKPLLPCVCRAQGACCRHTTHAAEADLRQIPVIQGRVGLYSVCQHGVDHAAHSMTQHTSRWAAVSGLFRPACPTVALAADLILNM